MRAVRCGAVQCFVIVVAKAVVVEVEGRSTYDNAKVLRVEQVLFFE
jgi:hypothetical protein